MKYFKSKQIGKCRGFALVITLSILVLMTALVLAFFSRSAMNRQIAFTSTNQIKTDLMARNALNIIVGEMRDEIADPSYSTLLTTGTPTLYQPKTAADALPKKVGVISPDTLGSTTLLKVATSGSGIRPNGPSTLVSSSVSIITPSLNGRYLSQARWFGANGPQLGTQTTLPTWMLITRGNGVEVPAITDAKDSTKKDFVIGRFAYTVYDIGGLMNANVAGYPTVASGTAAVKSSQAYSDLTAFGPDLSGLISWRNATTAGDAATFDEWATGMPRTSGSVNSSAVAAAQSGFISAAVNDNAVFSRRDLLNNPNLSPYSGYFTHFSRSLNAPTFNPALMNPAANPTAAVSATNPNLPDVRFTTTGTNTHYQDDGTTETYTVQAGDSLLQHRFSLAKLSWIGYDGPNTAAFNASLTSTQCAQAILDCFGLQWDSGNARWNYVAADSSNNIKTLSQLSGGTLEPNFFETLKAGILAGSIGKASQYTTMANKEQRDSREGVKDLQILRIGANIIDCANTDNYPRTISLYEEGTDVPVHGVQDLPYLHGLLAGNVWSVTKVAANTDNLDWYTLFLSPVLFNPHRSGITNAATPASIRVRIVCGTVTKVYDGGGSSVPGRTHLNTELSDPTGARAVVIPQTAYPDFQPYAKVVTGTYNSNTRLGSLLVAPSVVDAAHSDMHAFIFDSCAFPGTSGTFSYVVTSTNGSVVTTSNTGRILFRTVMSNVLVVLEFLDVSGQWRIYDTLAGNEAFKDSGTGLNNGLDWGTETQPVTGAGGTIHITHDNPDVGWNSASSVFIGKLDPRTTRFGVSRSLSLLTTSTTPMMAVDTSTTLGYNMSYNGGYGYFLPFGDNGADNNNTVNVFPARWTQGGKTNWGTQMDPSGYSWNCASMISNVADPDNVVRPADGWLGISNYPASNMYSSTGDNTLRPVILHRPFRSVGELGYVFRDTPWKTLSFFDETSGDSALLDLFSVSDEPTVTAARVHLDSSQSLSLQALIQGVAQESDGSSTLNSTHAKALATAYNGYAFSAGNPNSNMPRNISDMSTFMYSDTISGTLKGNANLDAIKNHRESVIRALGGSTQTRTWNLLIDVVAQSGRYPARADSLNDFVVEGERRYWMSVAIDRYTGAVISQQLEVVNE